MTPDPNPKPVDPAILAALLAAMGTRVTPVPRHLRRLVPLSVAERKKVKRRRLQRAQRKKSRRRNRK